MFDVVDIFRAGSLGKLFRGAFFVVKQLVVFWFEVVSQGQVVGRLTVGQARWASETAGLSVR